MMYSNNSPSLEYASGLLPYGALVQLDPELDLTTLGLSLPARRILEAMQTYGAYLVNAGGPDFGLYTAAGSAEFDRYGGVYRPSDQQGVQDEISRILSTSTIYVVPALVKR
jgi:hypothetical protein